MINRILQLVDGYKSYISAGLISLVVSLYLSDVLSAEQTLSALGLLGAGSVAALRDAIRKLENGVTSPSSQTKGMN